MILERSAAPRIRRQAGGARLPFLILLLIFCLSCATGGSRTTGPATVIDGVPFFAQEDYQCGPASLAAVLSYRGVKVTPGEIAAEIYSAGARGTLGIDMLLYARRQGARAEQYSGGFDDLKRHVDSGNPIIVLVDYGFWMFQKPHFMVIVGYGAGGFIVDSGKEHLAFISLDEFERIWERTKFWTLVIAR